MRKSTLLTVRIDAGGDCAALLRAIDDKGAWFLVKMKQTPNLVGAVWATTKWTTVERDAMGLPTRQVAEIKFEREGWPPGKWRVFAVRTNERKSGNQSCLWEDLDFSVHVFVTNDHAHGADELARRYDDRAGIEPVIGELKGGFGIGKVSTDCFNANEAAFCSRCSPSTSFAGGCGRNIRRFRPGARTGCAASASRFPAGCCARKDGGSCASRRVRCSRDRRAARILAWG